MIILKKKAVRAGIIPFSLLPGKTDLASFWIQTALRSHLFSCLERSFSLLWHKGRRLLSSENLGGLITCYYFVQQAHVLVHIPTKESGSVCENSDRTPNHDTHNIKPTSSSLSSCWPYIWLRNGKNSIPTRFPNISVLERSRYNVRSHCCYCTRTRLSLSFHLNVAIFFWTVEMSVPARSVYGDVCITDGTGKAAFRNIMCGAQYKEIDPLACFPFTNIRHIFQLGVLLFVSSLFGLGTISLGPTTGGLACGTNGAIVSQIDEGDQEIVRSHIAGQEMS